MRHASDFAFPSPETLECPYPWYEAMRRDEPVHRLRGADVYFVTRWDDLVYMADHPELFSAVRPESEAGSAQLATAPGGEYAVSHRGLSNSDGEEHRFKRNVALRLVSPERLRRFAPLIRELAGELIDAFAGRGEVELSSQFAAPLPVRVICPMLGVPHDEALFARMAAQTPASSVRFISEDARERRRQVGEEMHEFMRREILDRYDTPRDDFLTELVQAHAARADELPLEYLIVEATTLLFGGMVTTQHMIVNTMQLLLQNPAQLRRVQAERGLIRQVLEESLRVEAPFHLTETHCTADTELGGVPIPAGAAVYKVWGAGNRDPDRFAEPERFCPGRARLSKEHLGFGRGGHRCLGAPLALLEGTIAFELLLDRCRNLRFASGNDWTHVDVVSFRSLNRLRLEFDPEV